MQKSYRKNIRRDFRSNLNRFLSLFGIVALGVMMLTGLVSFAPSMRTAGQKYYVQQNATCGCSPHWAFRNQISPPLPPRRA